MQRYAEEALREHLTEKQKQFFEHWKGKEPWKEHPGSRNGRNETLRPLHHHEGCRRIG